MCATEAQQTVTCFCQQQYVPYLAVHISDLACTGRGCGRCRGSVRCSPELSHCVWEHSNRQKVSLFGQQPMICMPACCFVHCCALFITEAPKNFVQAGFP